MSLKKRSPAAYSDVITVMDIALKKPGLRYECDTVGRAINFKQRCNRYRNLMRDVAHETIQHVPGQLAQTAYDVLVIRQVDDEGNSSRQGHVLVFEHHSPEGKMIDPVTGEEIAIEPRSLFDDPE